MDGAGLACTMTSAAVRQFGAIRPSSFRAWRQALRLPSFSATLSPLLVGAAYASTMGGINLLLLALMVVASVACQAGANLANDYYDHLKGVDTVEQPGSSRVIQLGLLAPSTVRRGMIAAFVLATAVGFVIVAMTGIAVFVLALACLGVAVCYTAGVRPLGYVALGEVAVFLTMGLGLGTGSILALSGTITPLGVILALPNAFLITAALHVNNMRDVDRDRAAGKQTIAMRLGGERSNVLYAILISAAYASILVVLLLRPAFWPALMTVAPLPLGLRLVRAIAGASSQAEFSQILRGTNRLLIEVGILLALGILVGAAVGPTALAS